MWSGPYYYRSERTRAGPRRTYLGRDLTAHLAAVLDERRAEADALAAEQRRQERERERQTDADTDSTYAELRTVVRVHIVAAGWYAHRRQWRRYLIVEGDPMTEALTTHTDLAEVTKSEIEDLLERCNVARPKAADLAALRKVMASPIAGTYIGALTGTALARGIIASTGASKIVTDAELNRLHTDLGGDDCIPVERGLIDHIVTCWARVQMAEQKLTIATSGEHNRDSGLYWERRVTEAQRRYLRALALLAKMRALTSVQVNIATNQQVVNR